MIHAYKGASITFHYRNWQGEERDRTGIVDGAPMWHSTEWHPDRQWLLPIVDRENGERRWFAMRDMSNIR